MSCLCGAAFRRRNGPGKCARKNKTCPCVSPLSVSPHEPLQLSGHAVCWLALTLFCFVTGITGTCCVSRFVLAILLPPHARTHTYRACEWSCYTCVCTYVCVCVCVCVYGTPHPTENHNSSDSVGLSAGVFTGLSQCGKLGKPKTNGEHLARSGASSEALITLLLITRVHFTLLSFTVWRQGGSTTEHAHCALPLHCPITIRQACPKHLRSGPRSLPCSPSPASSFLLAYPRVWLDGLVVSDRQAAQGNDNVFNNNDNNNNNNDDLLTCRYLSAPASQGVTLPHNMFQAPPASSAPPRDNYFLKTNITNTGTYTWSTWRGGKKNRNSFQIQCCTGVEGEIHHCKVLN